MAILVIAEVKGQTQQGSDATAGLLAPGLRAAPGFIAHAAHAVDGGWRIVELWDSKDAADQFFARHVAPNLPQGIRPKRSVQELHNLVRS